MTTKPIPAWAVKATDTISESLNAHEWDVTQVCWPDAVARILVATREAALREAASVAGDSDNPSDTSQAAILALIERSPS